MGSDKCEDTNINGPVEHEESALVPKKRRVDIDTAVKLRRAYVVMSVISVILTGVLGAVTLYGSIVEGSSSSFAFALNGFLDSLSSMVLIWRFSGGENSLYSVRREAITCMILGVMFFLSALVIFTESINSLLNKLAPDDSYFLWWQTVINCVTCSLLLMAKIYIAVKLESAAILTDAFNTAAGLILAVFLIVSGSVYHHNHHIWQIDAIVSVAVSLAIFCYGMQIVYDSYKNIQADNVKTGEDTTNNENNNESTVSP